MALFKPDALIRKTDAKGVYTSVATDFDAYIVRDKTKGERALAVPADIEERTARKLSESFGHSAALQTLHSKDEMFAGNKELVSKLREHQNALNTAFEQALGRYAQQYFEHTSSGSTIADAERFAYSIASRQYANAAKVIGRRYTTGNTEAMINMNKREDFSIL
jgi:hypothetical protein